MSQEYWQKQAEKPLFPDILWSRPETKQKAGKLLIIGGQAEEFIHVAEAYAEAEKAGAGHVRVLMPDSTRKITKMLPLIEYAPANSSGSFSKQALVELIDASLWADGVLLAGDLGKNSETSLMLEEFIKYYQGLLIISGEAVASLTTPVSDLLNRPQTILNIRQDQLQKMLTEIKYEKAITSKTGDVELAEILHDLSAKWASSLVIISSTTAWVTRKGRVSSTKQTNKISLTAHTAHVAVWAVQQPSKLFETLTTAVQSA